MPVPEAPIRELVMSRENKVCNLGETPNGHRPELKRIVNPAPEPLGANFTCRDTVSRATPASAAIRRYDHLSRASPMMTQSFHQDVPNAPVPCLRRSKGRERLAHQRVSGVCGVHRALRQNTPKIPATFACPAIRHPLFYCGLRVGSVA